MAFEGSGRRSRASGAWVEVVVRGPLFSKKIDRVVKAAMIDECLKKINKRLLRPRKKTRLGTPALGGRRNVVTAEMAFGEGVETQATVSKIYSTLKSPRTKGTSWIRANVKIARAMAPRVLRKAAKRIVGELS